MTTDETTFVTQITPVDVGGVRDPGVASLVLLAASLGWNVLKKHNTPVVLTARDGTQKRLPTDSSCKLSVFQTALSTIMVHTDETVNATVQLMDAIIAETKVDRDHSRRLRLAVGENPATHRQRVANDKAAQRREDAEHLHEPIGVILSKERWDEAIAAQRIEDKIDVYLLNEELQEGEDTSAIREGLMMPHTPPFDGEEHGECISRKPFVAQYSGGGNSKSTGYLYESVTSLERIWEDGYKDYECQVCGLAKGSPRAVGSHRQVHVKAGEVERDLRYVTEKHRAKRDARDQARRKEVEFVDELPTIVENADGLIIEQIRNLVMPGWHAEFNAVRDERDKARKNLAELEGEFDALVATPTSRKKDRT